MPAISRTWQVYVQAEGDYRTEAKNIGLFYVRNNRGQPVPLSTLITMEPTYGPEFTVRYNEHSFRKGAGRRYGSAAGW